MRIAHWALTDWAARWPNEPSFRRIWWGLKVSPSTAAGHAALVEAGGGYLYFYIIICPRLRSAVGTISLHKYIPSPPPLRQHHTREYYININKFNQSRMGLGGTGWLPSPFCGWS
jgi:hypothetical protein